MWGDSRPQGEVDTGQADGSISEDLVERVQSLTIDFSIATWISVVMESPLEKFITT